MTQEDKQLLLKDLCVRLPYGVKIHINSCIEEQNHMRLFDVNLEVETIGVRNEKWAFRAIPIIDDEEETKVIKPYLRPMSSMTEEEKGEYFLITERFYDVYTTNDTPAYTGERMVFVDDVEELIDFYNSHHFDYRGLIEKGLAIEVTEENNPYK